MTNGSLFFNNACMRIIKKEIIPNKEPRQLIIKTRLRILAILFLTLFTPSGIKAQTNTVGLIMNDSTKSYNGYTLFSPIPSDSTFLIDNDGNLVHVWDSPYRPAQSVMLMPNGNILRPAIIQSGNLFSAGGAGGRVEEYDWNGNLTWSFDYYSSNHCSHHDVEYLPNGDILMIAWENINYDSAIAAGKNPAYIDTSVWSDEIIEVKPTGSSGGDIVWQWHAWDHLIQDYDSTKENYGDVAAHPELINVNYGAHNEDWLHVNSVRYNPQRDEILLSAHNFSEIWIIDHSTTTAQAAGHTGGNDGKGGDLVYRWGNPQAYNKGTASDEKLFEQHDARWIDPGLQGAGDIMIFNNGDGRPNGNYSSVDEITPPIDSTGKYYIDTSGTYGPATLSWSYVAHPPTSFFAKNISGEDRLPNGNTLICEGTAGRFFEVDVSGNIVWEYINPVTRFRILTQGDQPSFNLVFKIYRYSAQYSGLAGKDLSGQGPIEKYPTGIKDKSSKPYRFALEQNYPNPFNPSTVISWQLPVTSHVVLKVYDVLGREVSTLVNNVENAGNHKAKFDAGNLASGIYFYSLTAGNFYQTKKLILLK